MKKLALLFIPFILFSCTEKEEIAANQAACLDLYSKMKEWYLWNDRMPEVNPTSFSFPEELMKVIKYEPVDKWSNVALTYYEDRYPMMIDMWYSISWNYITGHGISLALDQNKEPRIVTIHRQSDLYASGVRRGWTVKTVNGVLLAPVLMTEDPEVLDNLLGGRSAGVRNVFEFINPEGKRVTLESVQTGFEADAVMKCDTLHLSSGITGYLLINSFLDYDEDELAVALAWLKSCNITGLIVDLRYCNTGLMTEARTLASAIAGNTYSKNTWLKIKYNSVKATNQSASMRFINTEYDLGVEHVVFITTSNTSAVSELVIAGLSPYLDVTVIGSQTTGNSFGISRFLHNFNVPGIPATKVNHYYSIVSCEYMSATSETGWYDGIAADIQAQDDITHDFGDRNESCMAAAIDVLEGNGVTKAQVTTVSKPFIFYGENSGYNNGATFVE